MKTTFFKGSSLLFMLGLFLISCTEDESFTSDVDDAIVSQNLVQSQSHDRGGNTDVVTKWTALYLELDRYAAGMRPNASARAIAYINLAAFETAVPKLRRLRSNDGLIPDFDMPIAISSSDLDVPGALNACYAEVLSHFFLNVPSNLMTKIDSLESAIAEELSRRDRQGRGGKGGRDSEEVIQVSEEWGQSVAKHVIAYSQTDVEAEEQILEPQPLSYEPPSGAGYWTYSAEPERALYPYWESVRTFIISPDQTSSIPPLSYSADPQSDYYQEYVEVYKANNQAAIEDGEQLWIAEFWSDDTEGIMFSPPARQLSIANQLVEQYGMDLEEALHLYLKLGFALNDAAVSTWKYKYQYMVQRPSTFIHQYMDPNYQTNLYSNIQPWPNPSFPGYPSGHSCFASAAGGVFIAFFGNSINFTDRSHEGRTEFRGSPRTFTSFVQMAEENGYSRIPLGVHIRMDCTEGLRLGWEISSAINNHSVEHRRS